MTYRMKTINIHRLLGAMLLAGIMLAGCTKDNTLEEIQQTATGQETPADEFAQTLESIDKVYNVEVKTSSSGDMMVIDPIAVHGHYFLDKELYTRATKQAIADAVNKWM